MSIEQKLRKPLIPFYALPAWRKLAIIIGFACSTFVAVASVNVQWDIYGGAPDHLQPEAGNVYPVHVDHGFLRYATLRDRERLTYWGNRMTDIGPIGFWLAFVTWISYSEPSHLDQLLRAKKKAEKRKMGV